MSIAAMNWALSQELETQGQQILLYVIADSCDPTGVTRHCDPEYLAEKSRMSRATMFRRLGEMEHEGVLARRKYFTEGGSPRYEIQLKLDGNFRLPLRGRRSDDDGGDPEQGERSEAVANGENHDDGHQPTSGGDGDAPSQPSEVKSQVETLPQSQVETLVTEQSLTGETAAVSLVRLHKSYSVQESSPLPPFQRGVRSKLEVEAEERRGKLWDLFRGVYPGLAAMDQLAARAALDALAIGDAEWAVSVCPLYATECRKLRKPPKNAHIWLRKRMFTNFAKAKIAEAPAEQVWVTENSDEDRALRMVRNLSRAPLPFVRTGAGGGRGYFVKTAIGADLMAMLAAPASERDWLEIERGTHSCGAWQARLIEWTGKPLGLSKPRLANGVMDPAGPDVIRAPWLWPPKKDGTIYSGGDPPSAPEQGERSEGVANGADEKSPDEGRS